MSRTIKIFKDRYERKIDTLMDYIQPVTRKYTKKECWELAGVALLILVVGVYMIGEYIKLDESEQVAKTIYGVGVFAYIWLEIFYLIEFLYNRFQTEILRNIYVMLRCVAIIFGGFFSIFLTILEMFAQKTNVYHVYKHFYLIFMAAPWTMILTMAGCMLLRALEIGLASIFPLLDWNFAIWIFLYLIIRSSFLISLRVGCRFSKTEKEIAKSILDEMSILFYIFLLICMLGIWGTGASENTPLWQGFLNATTVCLLWGTIKDKVGYINIEDFHEETATE